MTPPSSAASDFHQTVGAGCWRHRLPDGRARPDGCLSLCACLDSALWSRDAVGKMASVSGGPVLFLHINALIASSITSLPPDLPSWGVSCGRGHRSRARLPIGIEGGEHSRYLPCLFGGEPPGTEKMAPLRGLRVPPLFGNGLDGNA
jgi:hypothetical protein